VSIIQPLYEESIVIMKTKFIKLSYILFWTCLTVVLSSTSIIAQSDPITVSVDASSELGEISPFIFGINHGPWSEVSLQMTDAAKALDFTFLRWPGGNWGDRYNITKPQIDLYMIQAQNWGAIPSVHVRLEGGTPEQAAELVNYANIEKEYGIKYWYIGNEPNLFDDYTVERFNTEWRATALAMRAVDPDIVLIGPEVSQFPDTTQNDPNMYLRDEWVREFLTMNSDLVDIISVHRYPFPLSMAGDPTTIEQMRNNVPRWSTVVSNLRSIIEETVDEDFPIAFTEVNSHWSNSGGSIASPDSYYNAIWWSGVLTTLIHEKVDIVTYFILSSVGANGPFGILDRYKPRPTYYTYILYKEIGNVRLQSESSDPFVTALATKRDDGATTLLVTNLYEEAIDVTLDLSGITDVQLQDMRLLSPEVMAESVVGDNYLNNNILQIPAQSVILMIFE